MSRPDLRVLLLLVPLLAACGGNTSAGKCGAKACPSGQACETATGLCRPVAPAVDAGTDGGTGGGKDGGTGGVVDAGTGCSPACSGGLVCNVPARTCVQCLSSSDCKDAARPLCDTAAHVCTAPPTAGEACADARDINAAAATGSAVSFTLEGAASDEPPGDCGTDDTPERVFTFTTLAEKDARIELTQDGGVAWDPVMRVLAADCSSGEELACEDKGGSEDGELLVVPRLPAGTYFVVVDALDPDTVGAAELRVKLTDPKPAPANDTCATPAQLVLSPAGTSSSVTGDTTGATNGNDPSDGSPSCASGAGQDGLDVVYSFTVTQAVGVRFVATPSAGSSILPVLALRQDGCEDPATEVGCAYDISSTSGAAELTVPSLSPGTYYLWVDGADGQGGEFSLGTETFAPPPMVDGAATDACNTPPQDVVLSPAASGQAASFLLDTSSASDDAEADGYAGLQFGGMDAVLHLVLPNTAQVTVKVTPTSSSVDPVVYVREGPTASPVAAACTGAVTEVGYADDGVGGGVETLQFQPQTGMDYFLYVDSWDDVSAGMQLVEISQP